MWVDIIAPIIDNHNSSKHTTTKFTPDEIQTTKSRDIKSEVLENIKEVASERSQELDLKEISIVLGSNVRVSLSTKSSVRKNAVFSKGSMHKLEF